MISDIHQPVCSPMRSLQKDIFTGFFGRANQAEQNLAGVEHNSLIAVTRVGK